MMVVCLRDQLRDFSHQDPTWDLRDSPGGEPIEARKVLRRRSEIVGVDGTMNRGHFRFLTLDDVRVE